MKISNVVVGPIHTNCYLIESDGEAVIVDPGDELEQIMNMLGGRVLKAIWITHGHWDHVSALAGLQAKTGAEVVMSAHDSGRVDGVSFVEGHDIARGFPPAHVDARVSQGDKLTVGSCTFEVLTTPGHSVDSVCYYCEQEGVLFSGDTLFSEGRYGRTDFRDGNFDDIVLSMRTKLSVLPDETEVLCGHGQSTTIGTERLLNPYL